MFQTSPFDRFSLLPSSGMGDKNTFNQERPNIVSYTRSDNLRVKKNGKSGTRKREMLRRRGYGMARKFHEFQSQRIFATYSLQTATTSGTLPSNCHAIHMGVIDSHEHLAKNEAEHVDRRIVIPRAQRFRQGWNQKIEEPTSEKTENGIEEIETDTYEKDGLKPCSAEPVNRIPSKKKASPIKSKRVVTKDVTPPAQPSENRVNSETDAVLAPVKTSKRKTKKSDSKEDGTVNGTSTKRNEVTVDKHTATKKKKSKEARAMTMSQDIESEWIDRIQNVCIVDTLTEAKRVMSRLRTIVKKEPERVFACDTEVAAIDVFTQSPRGHGSVICISIYGGEDVNFAPSRKPPKTHIWIDTMGKGSGLNSEKNREILNVFSEFFNRDAFHKVWHNYGFDRHVMTNMGITSRGFSGDTMHMARLWDSTRQGKGYALESLTSDEKLNPGGEKTKKTSMKELFGRPKIKLDGSPGKLIEVPAVDDLQKKERNKFIHYSARDAKATYHLYQTLKTRLDQTECVLDKHVEDCYPEIRTLWDFYCHIWLPFGELLTDLEHSGFFVNKEHLASAQSEAEADREESIQQFLSWAKGRIEGGEFMNPSSDNQIRTLLFGGIANRKTKKPIPFTVKTKVENPDYVKHIQEKRTGKKPRRYNDVIIHSLWGEEKRCPFVPDVFTAAGLPAVSSQGLKSIIGKVGVAGKLLQQDYGVETRTDISDLQAVSGSATDDEALAPTDDEILYSHALNGLHNGLGPLYLAFDDPKEGLEACLAVEMLIEISSIETLLSTFIVPLQEDRIKAADDRIHCSMNINTETGRLSCRRPNLQNQPSVEKDRYKVRQAFQAAEGKLLIVADYGQLELRILAHLTQCKSMLDAFDRGGDFHSRTAVGMYDFIQKEIDEGRVAVEKGNTGQEIPLVKDVYVVERRRAKVLNFSIAYGKTPHGLAKDWKVAISEAEETLNRWYADRQEVSVWQQATIKGAKKTGYVSTLLGRRRKLPTINSTNHYRRSHAERAAINTPIQGSAADIAVAAMLSIHRNVRLHELGWKLLSQIHDEVILEGPAESVDEAQTIIKQCMERPFPSHQSPNGCNPLSVDLTVDINHAKNWYDAK